jgi:hypothetical protein
MAGRSREGVAGREKRARTWVVFGEERRDKWKFVLLSPISCTFFRGLTPTQKHIDKYSLRFKI